MKQFINAPHKSILTTLDELYLIISKVFPLRTTHKREVPYAVKDLSNYLTTERGTLNQTPYWASPRLTSAYMYYFLPWNIIRLVALLPNLTLPVNTLKKNPTIVDIGSGPLTLPIALWISRPDLRTIPLSFICIDKSPQPLELGKKILDTLSNGAWQVQTKRQSLQKLFSEHHKAPALIMAGNVLNEVIEGKGQEPLEVRLEEVVESMYYFLGKETAEAPESQILLIEPGTRLGSKCLSLFRLAALNNDLYPLAPCQHQKECPMLEPMRNNWCHFTFPFISKKQVPLWLHNLTTQAGFERRSVSISFLQLSTIPPTEKQPMEKQSVEKQQETTSTLILSNPITLDNNNINAQYACSKQGLSLITGSNGLPTGAIINLKWEDSGKKDFKTGAWLQQLPSAYSRFNKPDEPYIPYAKKSDKQEERPKTFNKSRSAGRPPLHKKPHKK